MDEVDLGGVLDVVVHDSALFVRRWRETLECSLANLGRFVPVLFYFVLY